MSTETARAHRVCVVTGAASGIGRSIAARLAADGWSPVLVDRDESAVVAAASEIESTGTATAVVVGDVALRSTHEAAARAAAELGVLTGWVNCAGVTRKQSIPDLTEEEVALTIGINQLGTLWGSASAVQAFDGRGGAIVNISSIHGTAAAPGHAAYEMTKGAIEALTRNISTAHAAEGVRANAVAPGAIMTPALAQSLATAKDPGMATAQLESRIPLRRIGAPAEIGAVVSFLLSDDASYLTGQTIVVDGGWTSALSPANSDPDAERD